MGLRQTLYIAAKAPYAGAAKSRLARAIGEETAAELYTAFLKDLQRRFACAPFEVGWYVTPEEGLHELCAILDDGGPKGHVPVLFQGSGDWTSRQIRLFEGASARGEEKVILIASDSPQLPVETIRRAFGELDVRDLVFGPVYDGGYYLIGMRPGEAYEALRDIPMSTATVLEEISDRARRLGLRVGEVEPTFDVDEVEDLVPLREAVRGRADLSHTREAMLRNGLL